MVREFQYKHRHSKQASAERELARFFILTRLREGAFMPMPGCPVDTFWHQLQETSDYNTFCITHAGNTISHCQNQGIGIIPWIEHYHAAFEESLPSIWFTSADGRTFHTDQWETYRSTAHKRVTNRSAQVAPFSFQLAWDCSPEIESAGGRRRDQ